MLCPKTIVFRLEFSPEIVGRSKYERLTLYNLDDVILSATISGYGKVGGF